MKKYDYDLIVIGSGPGGYVAALRANELGLKVAVVERKDVLGGTCLNEGCIPSKALLQSSEHYEWLKHQSHIHGIKVDHLSFDFSVMMQRKDEIVKGLNKGISALFRQHGIIWFKGSGHLTDAHTVEIVNHTERNVIQAANILIATGSYPIALPFLPFDDNKVLSSTELLSLSSVPKRLVVIGGGVIGVELASVYHRLGSHVTVIEMLNKITPLMDVSISKQLLQVLKKQGIEFLLGAKVTGATHTQSGIAIEMQHEENAVSIEADIVLVAIGRRPFTEGLGLETLGIECKGTHGILVDKNFRTTVPNIYAIGDAIEGPMLAHKASIEGVCVVRMIAGEHPTVNYIAIPNVIYTNPEAASVGLNEEEANQMGLDIVTGISYFLGNGRAHCSHDKDGFVKMIGERKSGRLIGMHIIGAHASELIAEGVLALEKGATLAEIANACHAHPTLSETIMEAAYIASKDVRLNRSV